MQKKKIRMQEAHVAGILTLPDGVVFLKKGHKDTLCLPQGRIDLHETPQIALKRIFWEKTGFLVDIVSMSNIIDNVVIRGGREIQKITTFFVVKRVGGEVRDSRVIIKKKKMIQEMQLDPSSLAALHVMH